MPLTVAIGQLNPAAGDLVGNVRKICSFITTAREGGADVIIFPNLAITGSGGEDLVNRQGFLEEELSLFEEVRVASEGVSVILGSERMGVLISEGNVQAHDFFDCIINIGGVRVGVLRGESPLEEVCSYEQSLGVDLIANLVAHPFRVGERGRVMDRLAEVAMKCGVVVVYVNMVGGEGEIVFDGGSSVTDPKGVVEFAAPRFVEGVFIHTIGSKISFPPPLNEFDEVYQALLIATRDYLQKNGFTKAVLGLSGGIDSSLTGVLCADAIGADNVTGVFMPSQITSDESREDALLLAENIGIEFKEIPITTIFNEYLRTLKEEFGATMGGVAEENLQPRIRANILMALSNKFGHLVVATGNRSESLVGYCTLYGDLSGGFAPISDVPKTMVYKLAEQINEKAGFDRIPRRAILKEPSAELRVGQKDTDTLPPYHALDGILGALVDEGKTVEEVVDSGYESEVVLDVIRRVKESRFKRRQAPPGVKITSRHTYNSRFQILSPT